MLILRIAFLPIHVKGPLFHLSKSEESSRRICGKLARIFFSTEGVILTPRYVRWEAAHGKENED